MLVLGVGRKEHREQQEGSPDVSPRDATAEEDDWVDPRVARPDLFSSERQTARLRSLERLGAGPRVGRSH